MAPRSTEMASTPEGAFPAWSLFLGYGDGVEGNVSMTSGDPGNFTPAGVLKGTRWGFSARSYPDLDFATLTPAIADALRHADFWTKIRGDELPGPVAFVLAEAAWGSGPGRAIMQIQSVVGTAPDRVFGPNTMTALTKALAKPAGIEGFICEYSAQRLVFEASLGTWEINRLGWVRRLFAGMAQALGLAGVDKRDLSVPGDPQIPVVVAEKRDLLPESRDIPAPAIFGDGTWLVTVRRAT